MVASLEGSSGVMLPQVEGACHSDDGGGGQGVSRDGVSIMTSHDLRLPSSSWLTRVHWPAEAGAHRAISRSFLAAVLFPLPGMPTKTTTCTTLPVFGIRSPAAIASAGRTHSDNRGAGLCHCRCGGFRSLWGLCCPWCWRPRMGGAHRTCFDGAAKSSVRVAQTAPAKNRNGNALTHRRERGGL